jgi:prepilin-type N-terminal cleavage/methylation domain-containing protein
MTAASTTNLRAFTIIELLVVVAIIALLIALLLPALQTARTTAKRVACLSNTRQIGIASMSYATEFGDFLPPGEPIAGDGRSWDETLAPYMNVSITWDPNSNSQPDGNRGSKAFRCPMDIYDKPDGRLKRSYLINKGGTTDPLDDNDPLQLVSVKGYKGASVSEIARFGDAHVVGFRGAYGFHVNGTVLGWFRWHDNARLGGYAGFPSLPSANHDGRRERSMWFLDGHSETLGPDVLGLASTDDTYRRVFLYNAPSMNDGQ